jgi:hypothetical protein
MPPTVVPVILKCLLGGTLAIVSSGCFYLAVPLLETLPQKPLRSVEVIDCRTGQPILQAKVTGLVLPYSHGNAFPSDSQVYSAESPYTIPEEEGSPVASLAYSHYGPGSLACSPGWYLGYETMLMIGIIAGDSRHGHFVCLVAEAAGYQSAVVGISQLDPPGFIRRDCISAAPFRYGTEQTYGSWSGVTMGRDGTTLIALKRLDDETGPAWRSEDSREPSISH